MEAHAVRDALDIVRVCMCVYVRACIPSYPSAGLREYMHMQITI